MPISQNITVSQSSGVWAIDPVADINMRGQGQGAITWTITTTGWNFNSSTGIAIDTNADQINNHPGQMPNQPNQWKATNHNNRNCDVKYTINVVPAAGGATVSLDPTIKNGT